MEKCFLNETFALGSAGMSRGCVSGGHTSAVFGTRATGRPAGAPGDPGCYAGKLGAIPDTSVPNAPAQGSFPHPVPAAAVHDGTENTFE